MMAIQKDKLNPDFYIYFIFVYFISIFFNYYLFIESVYNLYFVKLFTEDSKPFFEFHNRSL